MTFFVYIRLAVNVRHTVTVASSPSGTCVARRRRDTTATLSGDRIDVVEAVWPRRLPETRNPKRNHAHGRATATSLVDTPGRRATHVRDDDADHEDEGRHGVLAHT